MFGGTGAEGVGLHAAGGHLMIGDVAGVRLGIDQHHGVGGGPDTCRTGIARTDLYQSAGENRKMFALAEHEGAQAGRRGGARAGADGQEVQALPRHEGVGIGAHDRGESLGPEQGGGQGGGGEGRR